MGKQFELRPLTCDICGTTIVLTTYNHLMNSIQSISYKPNISWAFVYSLTMSGCTHCWGDTGKKLVFKFYSKDFGVSIIRK